MEWRTITVHKDEHTVDIEVSDSGKVRYKDTGKVIKNRLGSNTYINNSIKITTGVWTNKLNHRLVAEAFIDNTEGKPQVNHINADKSDNRVENLEWCTAKENMQHVHKNNLMNSKREYKITYEDAEDIRRRINNGVTVVSIANEYDVSTAAIRNIKYNRSFKHDRVNTNFNTLNYDKFWTAEEIRREKLLTGKTYVELGKKYEMTETNARGICIFRTFKREVYLNNEEIKRIENEEQKIIENMNRENKNVS